MKILIVGDSFAADWSQSNSAKISWTKLLSHDYEIVNLAQAGCSEYRILQQLKSQANLDQFDCVIVCHTSPDRIYTKQHPIHRRGLHQHADLIFSDIDYHARSSKNPAVICARDFFLYHYDECYQHDIYHLIVQEIDSLLDSRVTITVDNFAALDSSRYQHYLKFSDITEIIPGETNHCSAAGHVKIYQKILDMIRAPEYLLPDIVIRRLRSCKFTSYDGVFDEPPDPANPDYTYPIHYSFNSRGFRDAEWPCVAHLPRSIWCIGDSATMGIQTVFEHTWPHRLEQRTQIRTIKIAAPMISNDWIFRRAQNILTEIQPDIMILHWSFLTRRELSIESAREQKWQEHYRRIRDFSWPDCSWNEISNLPDYIRKELECNHILFDPIIDDLDRCMHFDRSLLDNNHAQVRHTMDLVHMLEQSKQQTKLIHSVVPGFATQSAGCMFHDQMHRAAVVFIPEFQTLDLAADNLHYDIKTSDFFVNEIMTRL